MITEPVVGDPRLYSYMFYGWAAAWLVIIAFVLTLVFREQRLRKELDRVRQMVEKK